MQRRAKRRAEGRVIQGYLSIEVEKRISQITPNSAHVRMKVWKQPSQIADYLLFVPSVVLG